MLSPAMRLRRISGGTRITVERIARSGFPT